MHIRFIRSFAMTKVFLIKNNNKTMKRLTPQEESIMLHVWEIGECAITTVMTRLAEPKPPYTTVASIFDNLANKEYLIKTRKGNKKMFKPNISQNSYKRNFLTQVVRSYFDDSYKEMVSFFAEDESITQEELTEIIELIEKNRK